MEPQVRAGAAGLFPLDAERRQRVLTAAALAPTPFYLLSLDAVGVRYQRTLRAWSRSFATVRLAYSYKTNAVPALTRTLLELGACAEVVSGVELEWALEDGAPPERIYFDGPTKSEGELRRALELGVHVQIDSVEEATLVAGIVSRRPSSSTLRLRLATPRAAGRWSRFGLFLEEVEPALSVLARAGARVSGVHLHVGSNVGVGPHAHAIEAWADLLRWFREHAGPSFALDVGGGYAAATAPEPAPEPEAYAESVAGALERAGLSARATSLVIEPGRSLVEDAGLLVTRVVSSKRRGDEHAVVCDAGTHLLRSAASFRHRVWSLGEHSGAVDDRFDLYGANCFEGDLLGRGLSGSSRGGGSLRVGDLLVIDGAGGYDLATSAGWIRPRPPVLAWDAERCFVARRAQSPAELRGAPSPACAAESARDDAPRATPRGALA